MENRTGSCTIYHLNKGNSFESSWYVSSSVDVTYCCSKYIIHDNGKLSIINEMRTITLHKVRRINMICYKRTNTEFSAHSCQCTHQIQEMSLSWIENKASLVSKQPSLAQDVNCIFFFISFVEFCLTPLLHHAQRNFPVALVLGANVLLDITKDCTWTS